MLVYEDQKKNRLLIKKFEDGLTWNNEGKLTFVELANSSNLPFTRSLHISVNNEDKSFVEKIGLHQYIYNVGSTSINLHTGEHTEEIKPGDSCYVKPFFKPQSYRRGKSFSLRIGGK